MTEVAEPGKELANPKPATPVNPDEIDQSDAPVKATVIQARTPESAAWMSFAQALLGAAEFRYLK